MCRVLETCGNRDEEKRREKGKENRGLNLALCGREGEEGTAMKTGRDQKGGRSMECNKTCRGDAKFSRREKVGTDGGKERARQTLRFIVQKYQKARSDRAMMSRGKTME